MDVCFLSFVLSFSRQDVATNLKRPPSFQLNAPPDWISVAISDRVDLFSPAASREVAPNMRLFPHLHLSSPPGRLEGVLTVLRRYKKKHSARPPHLVRQEIYTYLPSMQLSSDYSVTAWYLPYVSKI